MTPPTPYRPTDPTGKSDGFDSARIRGLLLDSVEVAAELVGRPEVGRQWNEPSALDGMTVGALTAHLVRGAGATVAYLDRTDPAVEPDIELLTPVSYFHAAIGSPIHERIREVSADESVAGHAAVSGALHTVAEELRSRLSEEPADRLIGALGGRMLTLDDFCRTRLIEILLHVDDLAVSIGVPRPDIDPAGSAIVIDILTGIARHAHGDWAVLQALARGERSSHPVFPVL